MRAGACEIKPGDRRVILRGTDGRPEEKHLLDGEFAVMPIATDEAILLFEIFRRQEFDAGDELADAGRMASSTAMIFSGMRRGLASIR